MFKLKGAFCRTWGFIALIPLAFLFAGCIAGGDDDEDPYDVEAGYNVPLDFDANEAQFPDGKQIETILQMNTALIRLPPQEPQKGGKHFVGYYTAKHGDLDSTENPPSSGHIDCDTIFTEALMGAFALYREGPPEGYHAVRFKLAEGGGREIKTINVAIGGTIPASEIPTSLTRPNYTRDGTDWHSHNGTIDLAAPVLADLELFPKWTGNAFVVIFNAGLGYIDGEKTKTYNLHYPESVFPFPEASHENLNFVKWSSSEAGNGAEPPLGPITENATYYARWELPESEDIDKDFDLANKDKPWLGGEGTLEINKDGYYTIELWGAQGGPAGNGNPSQYDEGYKGDDDSGILSGGKGAYTKGNIYLNKGDVLHFKIGGARVEHTDNSSGGGFNGGGNGYATGGGSGDGAGGGATDVRFGGSQLKHRIMVAAGGGGSSDGRIAGAVFPYLWKGGWGGGAVDHNEGKGGNGQGGTSSQNGDPGYGAGLDKGGDLPSVNGQSGTWGYGGNAVGLSESYGAGGGGWFGGGSGGQLHANGAGGGGSSYISGVAGFVACAESSNDEPKPPTGNTVFNNVTGGFVRRIAAGSGSPEEIATSWTGKVFTNAEALAGDQEMPKSVRNSGNEIGHPGPGSARIKYIGKTDS